MSNLEAKAKAMRYVENATEILSQKAIKDGKFYSDKKYVKMAGNTLWNGILLALDHKFPEIRKGKGRPDQTKYRQAIKDRKASKLFDAGYEVCHLSMGYDGILYVDTVKSGVSIAKELISWATTH
jgi:hypothetical protein